jgi:hypothetical protein
MKLMIAPAANRLSFIVTTGNGRLLWRIGSWLAAFAMSSTWMAESTLGLGTLIRGCRDIEDADQTIVCALRG